jgi:predicted PurR-regulated permease PerM
MDEKTDMPSLSKSHEPSAMRQPESVPESGKFFSPFKRLHKNYNRYVLIAAIVFLSIAVLPMVKVFAIPLMLAATFVTILYPMYQALKKALWNKPVLAAAASCIITVFCVLIPAYLFTYILTNQVMELYSTAEPKVLEFIRKGEEGKFRGVANSKYVRWIRRFDIDWRASLEKGLNTAAQVATDVINKTSASVLELAANVLITLFAMFYLFLDGKAFVGRLNHLIPLRQEYKDLLFTRFLQISRATVSTCLIIGLIQGVLGALTFLMFGIKSWLLWGIVMVLLSIIPMLGAWVIMFPAAVIQVVIGNVWQGIGIFLLSAIVISNIDSFLRPRLVGKQARMHDLVVFFATIGGIAAFGIMGFIIGPVIAALFVTIIDIYSTEFKEYLD